MIDALQPIYSSKLHLNSSHVFRKSPLLNNVNEMISFPHTTIYNKKKSGVEGNGEFYLSSFTAPSRSKAEQ